MRRAEKLASCTKMVYFFTTGSWGKDTLFGAARNFFGASYFVAALIYIFVYF